VRNEMEEIANFFEAVRVGKLSRAERARLRRLNSDGEGLGGENGQNLDVQNDGNLTGNLEGENLTENYFGENNEEQMDEIETIRTPIRDERERSRDIEKKNRKEVEQGIDSTAHTERSINTGQIDVLDVGELGSAPIKNFV